MLKHALFLAFLSLTLIKYVSAGNGGLKSNTTTDIQMMLKKLNVLGSAMYIAAHPDDENTRLITYLAKKKLVDVAYLSLTRGDGGQNMIGTEKGELLGLIRTQELLAARRIDGGEQFFTRANDFGYSKTYEESLNIWDEEAVLGDMIFVIRKYRPDVLVTRFAPLHYNYPTHGHHSASAYLAEKAFDMAGDPKAYPEQLELVDVWQPKRLYWNTSTWFYRRTNTELDPTGKIQIDVGAYVPAIGLSCTEIAAESRSQHKSQGFGAAKNRGTEIEFLEFVKGDSASADLFEGIDLTWNRIKDGNDVGDLLKQAYEKFDPRNPTYILKYLLNAYKMLEGNKDARNKLDEIKQTVAAICGLHMETIAGGFSAVPGNEIELTTTLLNRSGIDIQLTDIRYAIKGAELNIEAGPLVFNHPYEIINSLSIPDEALLSQPYWLVDESEGIGMYTVNDQRLRGMPELPTALSTFVTWACLGGVIEKEKTASSPRSFKSTCAITGLEIQPFGTFKLNSPDTFFPHAFTCNNTSCGSWLAKMITFSFWLTVISGVVIRSRYNSPFTLSVHLYWKGNSKTISVSLIIRVTKVDNAVGNSGMPLSR